MFSTVDRLAFVVRSMDFEVIAQVLMPIPIRRRDKTTYESQELEWYRYISLTIAETTACYADRKPLNRVLYGSVETLLSVQ
jgi:hypothetical protein